MASKFLDFDATSAVSLSSGARLAAAEAVASVTKTGQPVAGSYIVRIFAASNQCVASKTVGALQLVELSRLDGGYIYQEPAVAGASYTRLLNGLTIVLPNPLPANGAVSSISVSKAFDSIGQGTGQYGFETSICEKTQVIWSGALMNADTPGQFYFNAGGYSSISFTVEYTADDSNAALQADVYSWPNMTHSSDVNGKGSGTYMGSIWNSTTVQANAVRYSNRFFIVHRYMMLYQRATNSTNITGKVGTWYAHLTTAQSGKTL